MNFKLCENKTLVIDIQKLSKEEVMLIVSTVASACQLVKESGRQITVKVKENKMACTNT